MRISPNRLIEFDSAFFGFQATVRVFPYQNTVFCPTKYRVHLMDAPLPFLVTGDKRDGSMRRFVSGRNDAHFTITLPYLSRTVRLKVPAKLRG